MNMLESSIITTVLLVLAKSDTIEPLNYVTFPLKSSKSNTNTACSISELEPVLKKWSGNLNRGKSQILQVSENYCYDAFQQRGNNYTSLGLVQVIPGGQYKTENLIYQKACTFRCKPGYRFVDTKTGLIKGPLFDIRVMCNAKPVNQGGKANKNPAHWKIFNHFTNFQCQFSGEEGPSFIVKANQLNQKSPLVQNGRLGSLSKMNPNTTVRIPPRPCQFKRYLKQRNALFKYPVSIDKSENALEVMADSSQLADIHIIEDPEFFVESQLPSEYEFRKISVPGYYLPLTVVFRGDWLKLTKYTFEGTQDLVLARTFKTHN